MTSMNNGNTWPLPSTHTMHVGRKRKESQGAQLFSPTAQIPVSMSNNAYQGTLCTPRPLGICSREVTFMTLCDTCQILSSRELNSPTVTPILLNNVIDTIMQHYIQEKKIPYKHILFDQYHVHSLLGRIALYAMASLGN